MHVEVRTTPQLKLQLLEASRAAILALMASNLALPTPLGVILIDMQAVATALSKLTPEMPRGHRRWRWGEPSKLSTTGEQPNWFLRERAFPCIRLGPRGHLLSGFFAVVVVASLPTAAD